MKKIISFLLFTLAFSLSLDTFAQEATWGMAVFYSQNVRMEVKLNGKVVNDFSAPCTHSQMKTNEQTQKTETLEIKLEQCVNLLPFEQVTKELKKGENVLELTISPLMYKGKALHEYVDKSKKETAALVSILQMQGASPDVNSTPWIQYRENGEGKLTVDTTLDSKKYKTLASLEWFLSQAPDFAKPVTLTKKFSY